MRGFNRVVVIGNVVKINDLHETNSGRPVSNMIVAINRFSKTDNKANNTFVPITVWDDLAVRCTTHLSPGSPIFIEGRLQNGSYTKDGVDINTLSVVATLVTFLDKSKSKFSKSQEE